jgi:chromosome segregation ATPase
MKEALKRLSGENQEAQTEAASAVMDLELVRQSNETLTLKVEVLERELGEMKTKHVTEVERRRKLEDEKDELTRSKSSVETEFSDLKKICHQYEATVSDLSVQISQQENELAALKETLGEDSPLVDIAEVKAKLVNAEQELAALKSRVESTTLENTSLSRK